MRLILGVFLACVAIFPALGNERLRTKAIAIQSECSVWRAALFATNEFTEVDIESGDIGDADLSKWGKPKTQPSTGMATRIASRSKTPSAGESQCTGNLHRMPPVYPEIRWLINLAPHACVFVKFDINEEGATENIKVLHRLPEGARKRLGMWEDSTVTAVKQWCYPPLIVDGKPQRRENVFSDAEFELEVNRRNWEDPGEDKELWKTHAEKIAALSRPACEEFSRLYDEMGGNRRTPSSENDQTVTDAIPIQRQTPDWPPEISGDAVYHACVFVRFSVTDEGATDDVEVIFRAPTHHNVSAFDAAAIAAVKSWRYEPAMKDGQPMKQTGLVSQIQFSSGNPE